MSRSAPRRNKVAPNKKIEAALALHKELLEEIEEAMNDNGWCNLRRIVVAVEHFEKVYWPIETPSRRGR